MQHNILFLKPNMQAQITTANSGGVIFSKPNIASDEDRPFEAFSQFNDHVDVQP
jgi:hypothetical protein